MNIVKEFIKVGVDVNFWDEYYILLMVVCYKGYLIVVEELIEVGVDVNIWDRYYILLMVVC